MAYWCSEQSRLTDVRVVPEQRFLELRVNRVPIRRRASRRSYCSFDGSGPGYPLLCGMRCGSFDGSGRGYPLLSGMKCGSFDGSGPGYPLLSGMRCGSFDGSGAPGKHSAHASPPFSGRTYM